MSTSESERARKRRTNRRVLMAIAAMAAVFIGANALGLFDNKDYTPISHGNHTHFVPDDRAEGVSVSNCPQTAPGPGQYLSPQCQLITVTNVNGISHYVPAAFADQASPTLFPTTPPAPNQRILQNGRFETVAGDSEDH